MEKIKSELIEYLKTQTINSAPELWGHSKDYFAMNNVICGGGYASWQDNVSLVLRFDKETKNEDLIRFNVKLDEL